MEFLFEELTDEDGKIAIEFLRKRQKPGPGRDALGFNSDRQPRRRRAARRTERLGTKRTALPVEGMLRGEASEPRQLALKPLGRPKFARPPALLTTQYVDKL
ncbi:hypothetical protein CN210_32190 [Sinorhizobium meliloti]|nr:hypothetical protein CN210_32190 [Sinorhizobium meliloti]